VSTSAKNILLICGTLNQTRAMLKIGAQLAEHQCHYTPFYCDGHLLRASQRGQLDFTVLGARLRQATVDLLHQSGVAVDDRGEGRHYDLVITCTDLVIQENLAGKRVILVQEGLTEPEGVLYWMVKHLGVPRVFANTAAFGLSDRYELFCVASEGARKMFMAKGIQPEKMVVTGIPNFDDARQYLNNDFPYRDYVLVCTSNARETFKWDNRRRFLRRALEIAGSRPVIFKLHPAERHERATREIRALLPDALVLTSGNTEHMVANCSALVAQYSTVAFTAAALGKEVHSYIDPRVLQRILPVQNGGTSARNIAEVCRECLAASPATVDTARIRSRVEPHAGRALPLTQARLMPR
jgi:hypothetical protein